MHSFFGNLKKYFFLIILFCSAQVMGFGQNKVQYEILNWKYLTTPHFNIYYHQNQGDLPSVAYPWIENAYNSLSEQFQFIRKDHIPLIIYGSPNLFAQTNIITEILPEGVGGFTELFKTRIAIPFSGSYNELRHVLHHELVHAFVFGMIYDRGNRFLLNSIQIPFWFMEGGAEYLSSGWDIEADMFLMDQTINASVPVPGPELNGYLAYKGGQSFLFFLHSSRGDSAFASFLHEFRSSKSVENSIKKVYNRSVEELGKEWVQELRRIYWPEIGRRVNPEHHATAITSHIKTRDHFNLHPKISPDGKKIAFFSDRRDYTRILISDRKGKILHEISQSSYGGYFESFHPFRSGVCWSPDNKHLAFVTKSDGGDEIRIVNIEKKKLFKKVETNVKYISSPDWSKDGNLITFSGIDGGINDIYIYNIQTDSLSRLTKSIQNEENPHFSPDNKAVVFSIQDTAGSADFSSNAYKSPSRDLALVDILTGKQKLLTTTRWNEKQPCYSPNGEKLLFVSDRNGIDNLYIAPSDSLDKARPLTDYIGGCSNPDWSQDGETVVFCLFQQQGWDIWQIDQPLKKLSADTLALTRYVESSLDTSKHLFTPVKIEPEIKISPADSTKKDKVENSNDISEKKSNETQPGKNTPATTKDSATAIFLPGDSLYVSDTTVNISDTVIDTSVQFTGALPQSTQISPEPDSLSNEVSAVDSETTFSEIAEIDSNSTSADSTIRHLLSDTPLMSRPYKLKFTPDLITFGLGISTYYSPAGQYLLTFSDIMGDHQITIAGDIQGNFEDYIHLFGSYSYLRRRLDISFGAYLSKDYSNASIFGDRLYHDTELGGFFAARYPFSLFSRLDFEIFSRNIKREPVGFSGQTINSNALLPSLSYVYDNILWGITGPLNGVRASATLLSSPPLNFIDNPFVSMDADIRVYFHLFKRFVWANRAFLGASLALNEKSPGRRYMLGGSENWLLYKVNLDEYEKNLPFSFYSDFITPFRGWNYIDLSGTRAAVLNSEFRFPFIREISVAWPLPFQIRYINGALFTDIGNAWEAGVKNGSLPFPQKIYGGFGFGLRANLGIFVLRYDRGWPTDWRTDVWAPTNYFSLGAEF